MLGVGLYFPRAELLAAARHVLGAFGRRMQRYVHMGGGEGLFSDAAHSVFAMQLLPHHSAF